MNDLTYLAQKVWTARSFEDKQIHLLEMIELFQHKKQQAQFRRKAKEAFSPKELDWIAKNIALANMKVISK